MRGLTFLCCLMSSQLLLSSAFGSDLKSRLDYWRKLRAPKKAKGNPATIEKLIEKKVGELITLKSPIPANVTWDVPTDLATKSEQRLSRDGLTLNLPSNKPGSWIVKVWAVKLDVMCFWPTYPPTFIPPTHVALNGRPTLIATWRVVVKKD